MDFERLAARPETERMLGICVSQGGKKIGEFFREEDCRRNLYSASKSYTSCAVGIAEHEGLLSLSERVVDVFPEEIPAEVNEHLAHATVRDLLTMCLGQDQAYLMGGAASADSGQKLGAGRVWRNPLCMNPTRALCTTMWGRIWPVCWYSAVRDAIWCII